MGLFKRKRTEEPIQEPITYEPPPCKHKWRDFDWYIVWEYKPEYTYAGTREHYGELTIDVYEPYVCIWCKARENRKLRNIHFDKIDEQEAKARYEEIRKNPHVRPREDIEDEIADIEHNIDREYLAIAEKICPHRVGSPLKETH